MILLDLEQYSRRILLLKNTTMLTQMHYRVWISSFYSQTWQYKAATCIWQLSINVQFSSFFIIIMVQLLQPLQRPFDLFSLCSPRRGRVFWTWHPLSKWTSKPSVHSSPWSSPLAFTSSSTFSSISDPSAPVWTIVDFRKSQRQRGRYTKKCNNSTRCE